MKYRMLVCGGLVALLSGCVDKSFDLDNFDSTSQIKVNNLTLPVEFTGGITFSDVVSDNDLVQEDANGSYVLIQEGEFESEEIEINEIVATPNVETFKSEPVPIRGEAGQSVPFNVENYARFDFEFSFDLVDNYIRDITRADVDFDIDFRVEIGFPCALSNLSFHLPSGMKGSVVGNHGTVTQNGSLVTFNRVNVPDGVFEFTYHVTEIDIHAAGGNFNFEGNGEYGVFHLKNYISLVSGNIEATGSGSGAVVASFNIGTIRVNAIDGSVCYTIDDIEESTNLDELPDLLTDPATRLGLTNPQLYISVTNPFAEYGAKASTNITLEQVRTDADKFLPESRRSVTSASPVEIADVAHQNFVLSASEPSAAEIYAPYAGAKWTPLQGMGYIVYGKGLPEHLSFIFSDPKLDSNDVRNFPIGRKVGRVSGTYAFYAPLDFVAGSQIVYTQDQNGWNLTDFVVTAFEINTTVNSSVPVEVLLSAYPLVTDEETGETIVRNDLLLTSTSIPPMVKNLPVTIKLEMPKGEELKNLDGIRYTIMLKADNNNSSIGPNQELTLDKFKATVSGYYDFKDDDKDEDGLMYDDDYDY